MAKLVRRRSPNLPHFPSQCAPIIDQAIIDQARRSMGGRFPTFPRIVAPLVGRDGMG
jgi:hypothetical protein